MAKDFNNRLINSRNWRRQCKTIRSIPRIARRRMQFASQCFSSATLAGTFLKDSEENDDFLLFGIVVGLAETEYSYISANEMASVELDATKFGLGKVRVEQRKPFQPCQLSEIIDRELQSFLSRLYD